MAFMMELLNRAHLLTVPAAIVIIGDIKLEFPTYNIKF
jgi:hypothetical protein